ncbi:DUF1496 domain-containing protein [Erwinia sp. P6884]|uniref:DUF1496 domain-containing protein n=1 Tax=Erwinia sp. P6884 TaxID=3141450 RepID=UPI00319A176D
MAEGQSLHVGSTTQSTAQTQHSSGGHYQRDRDRGQGHGDGYDNVPDTGNDGYNADVVVDLPPEAWSKGGSGNQKPCLRCCTYENRSYTEGSVVKMEGVLLQCRRDEQSIGTNNLIWQIVK